MKRTMGTQMKYTDQNVTVLNDHQGEELCYDTGSNYHLIIKDTEIE